MIDYQLRITLFIFLLSVLLSWQWIWPRSSLKHWQTRWQHNGLLLVIDAILVRLCQPLLLTFVALLPNAAFAPLAFLPNASAMIVGLILMDAMIYWQHRLFHQWSWGWRLHRVHHSDPELDTSSAVRFHPLEILLSLFIKAAFIWLLGVPAIAVLLFDILLNGFALFNHTNVRLPESLERILRFGVVTPDMHRIHHSRDNQEASSNFGFCLSIWDRLFNSYRPAAKNGDEHLNIGMPNTHTYAPESVTELLKMPFTFPLKGHPHSTKEK